MADLKPARLLQLETYKLLRNEIDQLSKSFDTYAIAAVVATATTWGWILIHETQIGKHPSFYLAPALCALFFGLRVYAIMQAVTVIGSHLAKIEREFGLDEKSGWECFCEAERNKSQQDLQIRTSSMLGLWQWGFWPALILLNLGVGLVFMRVFC